MTDIRSDEPSTDASAVVAMADALECIAGIVEMRSGDWAGRWPEWQAHLLRMRADPENRGRMIAPRLAADIARATLAKARPASEPSTGRLGSSNPESTQ